MCNTYQHVLRQDLCLSRGSSTLGVEGGTPERPIKIKWGIRRHLQEGPGCVQHISTRTASGLVPGAAPPSGKRQGIQSLWFPEIGFSTRAQGIEGSTEQTPVTSDLLRRRQGFRLQRGTNTSNPRRFV